MKPQRGRKSFHRPPGLLPCFGRQPHPSVEGMPTQQRSQQKCKTSPNAPRRPVFSETTIKANGWLQTTGLGAEHHGLGHKDILHHALGFAAVQEPGKHVLKKKQNTSPEGGLT